MKRFLNAIENLYKEKLLFNYTPQSPMNYTREFNLYNDGQFVRIELEEDININNAWFMKEKNYGFRFYISNVTTTEKIKEVIESWIENARKKDRIENLFKEKDYFYKQNTPVNEKEIRGKIYSILKQYYTPEEIETYAAKMIKERKGVRVDLIRREIKNIDVIFIKRLDHYFLVVEDEPRSTILHYLPHEREKGIEDFKKVCIEKYTEALNKHVNSKLFEMDDF